MRRANRPASARAAIIIGAIGAVAALVAGAVAVRLSQNADATAATASPAPLATVQVTRTTLVQTASMDGTLGYGATEPIESKAAGTLTWLPNPGDTVARGGILLRADELAVVLLYGKLPSYRPLALDTVGDDVKQFEANLRALGYSGFTVDQRYSAETAAAVKRWQRDLDRPQTGTVDPDAVVYLPGAVRIASQVARLGRPATGQVLTYTGTSKVVTAQVPARNAGWAAKGARVDVVPPVGGPLAGTVSEVGTELSAGSGGDTGGGAGADTGGGAGADGGSGTATVTVTITIADQDALRGVDQAPVKVLHVLQERQNVLTVPVTALLAPIEGGYAVEVVEPAATRLVPVQTGLFAEGRVEISGTGIDAGTKVKVPA